jgi:hypothetical protein
MMDSSTVSNADEIDTPLSFFMDSTENHCNLIKGNKNSIPLSFYTTTLVYHPAESKIDIFETYFSRVWL